MGILLSRSINDKTVYFYGPISASAGLTSAVIPKVWASLRDFFDECPAFERVASFVSHSVYTWGESWYIYRAVSTSVATGATFPKENIPAYDIALYFCPRWDDNFNKLSGTWIPDKTNSFGAQEAIGIALAYHSSGVSWRGTTNDDGLDSFDNNNPWTSGSIVLPRQNMQSGAFSYTQNYMITTENFATNRAAPYYMTDGDFTFFTFPDDGTTTNIMSHIMFFGAYEPFGSLKSNIDLPFCMYAPSNAPYTNPTGQQDVGNNTSAINKGGATYTSSSLLGDDRIGTFAWYLGTHYQAQTFPNYTDVSIIGRFKMQITRSVADLSPLYVLIKEEESASFLPYYGPLGRVPYIRTSPTVFGNNGLLYNSGTSYLSFRRAGEVGVCMPWGDFPLSHAVTDVHNTHTGNPLYSNDSYAISNSLPTIYYRGTIGSEYVYWSTLDPEPDGVTMKQIIGREK